MFTRADLDMLQRSYAGRCNGRLVLVCKPLRCWRSPLRPTATGQCMPDMDGSQPSLPCVGCRTCTITFAFRRLVSSCDAAQPSLDFASPASTGSMLAVALTFPCCQPGVSFNVNMMDLYSWPGPMPMSINANSCSGRSFICFWYIPSMHSL